MRIFASAWILGLLVVSAGGCGAKGGRSGADIDASITGDPSTGGGGTTGTDPAGGGSTSILVYPSGDVSNSPGLDPDAGICDRIRLAPASVPPRVLFIQDVSSSMKGQWQPLHDGMVSIAKQFGDRMLLGFVPFASVYFDRIAEIRAATDAQFQTFFNAHDNDCDVSDSSIITPGATSAAKIIATYDSVVGARMVGGTPTYTAMEKARKILVDAAPKDGSPGYAILVTDGEPNCSSSPTGNSANDIEASIQKMTKAGVSTFVVGYNYTGANLDRWAKAGNTTKYINVSNTGKLGEAISGILVGVLPCQFSLSAPVERANYVRVTVDGKDRELNNAANGWTLGTDGKTITLTGQACGDIRTVGQHAIDVVVECAEVVIY